MSLTIAIGVAATTASFSAVDTVLLRDLPVEEQEALVVVWRLIPERGSLPVPFRAPAYDALQRGMGSLYAAAGVSAWGALPVPVGTGPDAHSLRQARIAGDFFGVMGTRPTVGRLSDASDDRVDAEAVAVLSHAAWRSRYAADPEVVGSSILVDGSAVTVVGVAPVGFDFPRGTDLWAPLRHDHSGDPGFVELHLVGRMGDGVDPGIVAADLQRTLSDSPAADPSATDWIPIVRSLDDLVRGEVRPLLRAAFAAAALLLSAAAANGALLLLAGGGPAIHDFAVRRALGADRSRVLTQVTADATVVGAAGTTTGIVAAWATLAVLVPLAPPELPRLDLVSLDVRSVTFATLLGFAAIVAMAAVATLATWSRSATPLLSGARGYPSAPASRSRSVVAGVQVALTVVSATAAGLLLRTVWTMDRIDTGMAVGELTAVSLRVPHTWFEVPETYFTALEAVVRDLEARPGIDAVRPTLGPPLAQRLEVVLVAEEQAPEAADENPYVAIDAVQPGHFEALGIPLLSGRGLTALDDRPDADPVVVIDEVLARAIWPDEDPLGRRLSAFGPEEAWYTIVGVVAGTRYRDYLEPHPRAYFPIRRLGTAPPSTLLVRHPPGATIPVEQLARAAFTRVDTRVRVMGAQPLTEAVRAPTVGRRFAASILVAFAVATILLALSGVYGVVTVSVGERVREMGVRRALGAGRASIVGLVLGGTLRVAGIGAATGLLIAVWSSDLLDSLLYGVGPLDIPTFAGVAVGAVGMSLLAGLAPAVRASRVDPAESLRAE